jgi:hypothetical protein
MGLKNLPMGHPWDLKISPFFSPFGGKVLPWRKTFSAFACEQASRLREAETVLHKEFIANVTLHLREEVGRLGGRF